MRLKHAGVICVAGALTAAAAFANRPNIIVVYTDDHGYADLGCQGVVDDVRTPNIDRLAQGGVRMTDGYSTAPQCAPSRIGLISGCYQNRLGLESNSQMVDPDKMERFFQFENLPKRLKKAGYVTGMAGKSHLGSNDSGVLKQKVGFDKAFFKHSGAPGHWNMNLDGQDTEPQVQKGGGYHLNLITDFACSFIERFKEQPFFFYLAYRAPHIPLDAPQEYLDRFPGEMPERRRQALAMISCIDDGVGRIVETLEKYGIRENTIIWIISDNGAPLKMHKLDKPGGGPGWDGSLNDPMNGEKGMLTEGGIRVPFVVHWKGTIPGGQVYTQPVITLDVAATSCALAGLPGDPALDGVNLLPYLTGVKEGAPHEALYWRWLEQSAIRKGKWKYLRGAGRDYLFDMENDFEETNNLLQTHPELAQQLTAELKEWADTLDPPGMLAFESPRMKAAATRYFDWYLDGKRRAPASPAADKPVRKTEPAKKKEPDDLPLFKRRDRNKDGVVTWQEYLGGRTEKVDRIRKVFDRHDTNGDGLWQAVEAE